MAAVKVTLQMEKVLLALLRGQGDKPEVPYEFYEGNVWWKGTLRVKGVTLKALKKRSLVRVRGGWPHRQVRLTVTGRELAKTLERDREVMRKLRVVDVADRLMGE